MRPDDAVTAAVPHIIPRRRRLSPAQDHVAKAFARSAQAAQAIDNRAREPDIALAPLVYSRLEVDAAKGHRSGDRVEGGLADGNADHAESSVTKTWQDNRTASSKGTTFRRSLGSRSGERGSVAGLSGDGGGAGDEALSGRLAARVSRAAIRGCGPR
jgi:hypothetical protein